MLCSGTLGNSLRTMEVTLQAEPEGCERSLHMNCIDQKLLSLIIKIIESAKIGAKEKGREKEGDGQATRRANEFGQKDIMELAELRSFDALPKWKEEQMDVVCQSTIQPFVIPLFGNSSLGMTCIFAENFVNCSNDPALNPFLTLDAFSNDENQLIQLVLFILGIHIFLLSIRMRGLWHDNRAAFVLIFVLKINFDILENVLKFRQLTCWFRKLMS